MKKYLFIVAAVMISISGFGQTKWTLDKSHTNIGFTITHMMISEVYGEFTEFDGEVVSTSEDFDGSKVSFTAKVESINTENEKRDQHLQSDDFFNAKEFPELTFDGKIVKENDKYFLIGDFTIRDVKEEVKFDVRYNGTIEAWNGKKAGFKITGTIDRFDYNLKWDRAIESGGLIVSREVTITCNVELDEVKQ
jgi:polyisoprenoid-binding protein YceI